MFCVFCLSVSLCVSTHRHRHRHRHRPHPITQLRTESTYIKAPHVATVIAASNRIAFFFMTTHTSAYVSIRQQNATVIVASHRTRKFVCPPAAACHRDRHIICRIVLRTHTSVCGCAYEHAYSCIRSYAEKAPLQYLFICLL